MQPYHFLPTKALLKFYSFYPDTLSPLNTLRCLLLALSDFPSSDFSALTFIVQRSEKHADYSMRHGTVERWASQIETGNFKKFWVEFNEEKEAEKERASQAGGADDEKLLPLTTLFPVSGINELMLCCCC